MASGQSIMDLESAEGESTHPSVRMSALRPLRVPMSASNPAR